MNGGVTIEPMAEDALLLRFGDGIDIATNARVHAAARALREANLAGVIDVAPAYATLLVRFDPFVCSSGNNAAHSPHERLSKAVHKCLLQVTTKALDPGLRRDDERKAGALDGLARNIEIPVCYGGEFGPDLGDVTDHTGISPNAVIARHAAAEYIVAMLGFAPGFPYLLGLDPALQVPRRANPRTRVPAGSVAIGGAQTGIYPRELPGGWQLIGRTPLALFDPQRQPPCLLAPGDKVRFRAIERVEFEELREKHGHRAPGRGRHVATILDGRDQG